MEKVTLQDLVKELGVSKGTIGRVLRGSADVSQETRRKVLAAIEKYDYRPDKIARTLSLKTKKIKIGAIYQKAPEFFWKHIKEGFLSAAGEFNDFGLEVLYREIDSNRNVDELLQKIDELVDEKVDAITMVPLCNEKLERKIQETIGKGIAVSTFNDDIKNSGRLFYIGPQMRQSGRIAGELMGKFLRGKGNILTINGDIESMAYKERLEGFTEVIQERYRGITIITNYTCNYEKMKNEAENIIEAMIKNVDGIAGIYNVDGATLHNIAGILKKNRRPEDISLIGHERWSQVDRLISEGFIDASICQDSFTEGYLAIKILFSYLLEKKKPEHEEIFVRSDIIIRENLEWTGAERMP